METEEARTRLILDEDIRTINMAGKKVLDMGKLQLSNEYESFKHNLFIYRISFTHTICRNYSLIGNTLEHTLTTRVKMENTL